MKSMSKEINISYYLNTIVICFVSTQPKRDVHKPCRRWTKLDPDAFYSRTLIFSFTQHACKLQKTRCSFLPEVQLSLQEAQQFDLFPNKSFKSWSFSEMMTFYYSSVLDDCFISDFDDKNLTLCLKLVSVNYYREVLSFESQLMWMKFEKQFEVISVSLVNMGVLSDFPTTQRCYIASISVPALKYCETGETCVPFPEFQNFHTLAINTLY